jgi:hypothetical protein
VKTIALVSGEVGSINHNSKYNECEADLKTFSFKGKWYSRKKKITMT